MALDLTTQLNPENLNLAENVDDDTLIAMGAALKDGYETDEISRQAWLEENEGWMKLATQYKEVKTFPWPNAANVKYPLVTTAAMQFAARAYPALLPNKKPVKSVIIGKETDQLTAAAAAIGTHMSYQLMYEMKDWEEEMDKLCMILPIAGTVFKKTYNDPIKKYNCSELVLAKDLVVNYWSKTIEDAPRICHILAFNKNEIEERQRRKIFLDIDLGDPVIPEQKPGQLDVNRMEQPSKQDYTTPYTVIECHTTWDLDDDGYAEPYIITFALQNAKVLRIIPRFYMEDIEWDEDKKTILSIEPIQYFTKFGFIPNPDGGLYDLGFGLLLGPLNETINTSINQLLDAGTLSTLQAGFLGKGIRIKGGEYRMAPNEWKVVNATVDDLRKAIFPLPVHEPSHVLFQLLGSLVESGEKLASIAEIFVGKMPGQNTPATTTLETVKQGMAVFTAIYKRIYRSLDKEYKKLFKLNRLFLDDVVDYPVDITKTQYQDDMLTVVPTADPDAATDAEKLVKAQTLLQLAESGMVNPQVAVKRLLEAMRIEGIDELMNMPQPQPSPEQQKAQMEMQIMQQQHEFSMQENQQKMQIDQMKGQQKLEEGKAKLAIQQQDHLLQVQHEQEVAALDMQIKQAQAALDNMVQEHKAAIEMKIMEEKAALQKQIGEQQLKQKKAMATLASSGKSTSGG